MGRVYGSGVLRIYRSGNVQDDVMAGYFLVNKSSRSRSRSPRRGDLEFEERLSGDLEVEERLNEALREPLAEEAAVGVGE